ncbi:uncharacterized protein [Salvelinus sp. IW2-2015]|uniref:uncharacterized protein isoform X1 n=1 Tax=Salvelinus sp. IW2-2015 TaxID=2691554 RepID=UPI0038D44F3F
MALFIPDMAGHLFLVILLFDTFQYIEAQDLPPPSLTVSSAVINEIDSVQLSCETPPSLHVSQCYFYIEGGKNLTDSSCTQTLTGTELLKRSGPTFPAVVKVKCYYTIERSHTSPFSYPVSVTVQDPPPPRLTVSSTVIRERDSVQLSCQTLPSVTVSHCYFYIEGIFIYLPDSSCTQTLTGIELLKRADQTFSAVVKVMCYYAVESTHTSPLSDPVSVIIQGELQKPDIDINDESSHDITIICVLPESVSNVHSCNLYTGDQPQAYKEAQAIMMRWKSSVRILCTFSVSKNDLFSRLQERRDVSCDYRENTGSLSLSPHSDLYNFTGKGVIN